MSKLTSQLEWPSSPRRCALAAGAAHAADMPKIGVDLTTLTSPFWTAYAGYLRRRGQGPGRRTAGPDQLRIRHRQADHRHPEPDQSRRQRHHLLALRIRRRRHDPEGRREGRCSGRRRRRGALDRSGRHRRARRQPRLWPSRPANISASTSRKAPSCRSWATRPRSTDATAASASASASRNTRS